MRLGLDFIIYLSPIGVYKETINTNKYQIKPKTGLMLKWGNTNCTLPFKGKNTNCILPS